MPKKKSGQEKKATLPLVDLHGRSSAKWVIEAWQCVACRGGFTRQQRRALCSRDARGRARHAGRAAAAGAVGGVGGRGGWRRSEHGAHMAHRAAMNTTDPAAALETLAGLLSRAQWHALAAAWCPPPGPLMHGGAWTQMETSLGVQGPWRIAPP